jgi:hypothetical protein
LRANPCTIKKKKKGKKEKEMEREGGMGEKKDMNKYLCE